MNSQPSPAEARTQTFHVTMPCRFGLHARNACMFLQFSKRFSADIFIRNGDTEVDGKSILGLLMLGAAWRADLLIRVEGDDAEHVAREIQTYFMDESHCADD